MPSLKSIVAQALAEDIGRGDITTEATVPSSTRAIGRIVARQNAVVAGLCETAVVYSQLGGVTWRSRLKEGARVKPGQVVAEVRGRARAILTGERVALNFLQRLSGIATLTRRFVDAVKGTKARIFDTRKTTPGLRMLERFAVAAGGGLNHRWNLNDSALIKDNHIVACDRIASAVAHLRRLRPRPRRVEIEAQSRAQALAFAQLDVDVLMLDNMPVRVMRHLVPELRALRPDLLIEASGGVTLKNVRAIAKAGVDWISVGALTHSAPAVDFSLDLSFQ